MLKLPLYGLALCAVLALLGCEAKQGVTEDKVSQNSERVRQSFMQLRSKSKIHHTQAIARLRGLKPADIEDALPAVLLALKDENKSVRVMAAGLCLTAAPKCQGAAEDLKAALKDSDLYVRVTCAQALLRLGQAWPEAAEAIIKVCRESQDERLRNAAALSLQRLEVKAFPKQSAALVLTLRLLFNDDNADIRALVVSALLSYQETPKKLAEFELDLKILRDDSDERVRRLARKLLKRIQ